MCKKYILIVLCGLILHGIGLQAQKPPMKWGKIPNEDLTMTVYSDDTSAAAVILCDFGKLDFSGTSQGLVATYTYHRRIKILTKAGLDWADVEIPFYKDQNAERVGAVKATTYNLLADGSTEAIKLNKKDIITENYNEYYDVKKFSLKGVKEGSVIEYTYQLTSKFVTSLEDWQFQTTEPVRWSEYWAHFPEYLGYVFLNSGLHNYHIKEIDPEGFCRWAMKDMKAIREEPYITTMKDYFARIQFQLSDVESSSSFSRSVRGSWQELSKELMESQSFGQRLRIGNGKLKKIAGTITLDASSDTEKLQIIYDYVVDNFNWNGRRGKYVSQPLNQLLTTKSGRGVELNFALIVMLQKVGISAHPVLMSTRSHGQLYQQYPFMNQFNHVIAYAEVDGKEYLMDAIDNIRPMNLLPIPDLNRAGLIVDIVNPSWVSITPQGKLQHMCYAKMTMDEDGALNGTFQFSDNGYSAALGRNKLAQETEDEYVDKRVSSKMSDVEIEGYQFENVTDVDAALKLEVNLSTTDYVEEVNEFFYVNPMMIEKTLENPLKLLERSYPVDFAYPYLERYVLQLSIPEQVEVIELPKPINLKLENKGATFKYMASINGSTIQISSTIKIDQVVFNPMEYSYIKEFFDQIVAKQNELIILKKVE